MAPTVPPGVSANALMVSSVDHAAHEIWDVAAEPPKADSDWLEIEYDAIQLVALDAARGRNLEGRKGIAHPHDEQPER